MSVCTIQSTDSNIYSFMAIVRMSNIITWPALHCSNINYEQESKIKYAQYYSQTCLHKIYV